MRHPLPDAFPAEGRLFLLTVADIVAVRKPERIGPCDDRRACIWAW
jgi:hypothetical protein